MPGINRRSFLQAPAALAAVESATAAPNFVFLISDDHSFPDLGCYGNTAVRTPHLDRMAREGVRFEHCYVSSPQCSPNRSSILTGCTPHTTATSRLHTPMPPWEPTFLEPLRERGYFAGAFRKVHQGEAFDKRRWDFYGGPELAYDRFFEALPAGRPFFLHVGFTDPHRPYRPGAFSPPHDPASVRVPPFLPDAPEVRQDIAHYYDAIARMDSDCGTLFESLRRRGLSGNTLAIFTGDNGMPFPRAKGTCYDPGIRVPLIAWWPGRIGAGEVRSEMIAHVDLPSAWLDAAGVKGSSKMQGRSFLPLLLGRSYQPREEVFAERNWHDNFDPIRCVRTRTHKLIFNAAPHFPFRPARDIADGPSWPAILRLSRAGKLRPELLRMVEPVRPVLELYDLQKDPNEFHNVATDPAYAEALQDLRGRLARWMDATYDFLPPAQEDNGRGWPVSL
jgi:arylsulfatase A-like enzyme